MKKIIYIVIIQSVIILSSCGNDSREQNNQDDKPYITTSINASNEPNNEIIVSDNNVDNNDYEEQINNDEKSYVGTYYGASDKTTLILNNDKTCIYDEYGIISSYHFDGTYEISGETIICTFKDLGIVYAEIKNDGGLYLTSDLSKWNPEYFSKNPKENGRNNTGTLSSSNVSGTQNNAESSEGEQPIIIFPDLPLTINNSNKTTITIDKIEVRKYNKALKSVGADVYLTLIDGKPGSNNYCSVDTKIRDEDGIVVDTGYLHNADNLCVGDTVKGSIVIQKVEPGKTYTLEFIGT